MELEVNMVDGVITIGGVTKKEYEGFIERLGEIDDDTRYILFSVGNGSTNLIMLDKLINLRFYESEEVKQ